MNKHIAVLPGDGIGPEITDGAVAVLQAVAQKFGHTFTFENLPIGLCALEVADDPLPRSTIDKCLASDSVLLGAVGGAVNDPRYNALPAEKRPETGLLKIRKAMGLYSNIRPARLWAALADASPLKRELVEKGINYSTSHVDFMIGTRDLKIVGTKADGSEVTIFENGTWAI